MDRRKTGDALFFAIQCAISDREAYVDAVSNCGGEQLREAKKDVAAFRALSRKIFGTDKSRFDELTEKARTVSIHDLHKLLEAKNK